MAHWFFIHLFKLFSLEKNKLDFSLLLLIYGHESVMVCLQRGNVQESPETEELLSLHSFAVTLRLKAFGIVEHDRRLVQASGHTQICQIQWLTLGNAGVCNPGK